MSDGREQRENRRSGTNWKSKRIARIGLTGTPDQWEQERQTRRVFYDASIAQDDSLKLSGLLRRSDQVLSSLPSG